MCDSNPSKISLNHKWVGSGAERPLRNLKIVEFERVEGQRELSEWGNQGLGEA